MDEALKQYLQGMESRIEDRIVSMEGRMVSMEGLLVELKAYIDQRSERVETALLTEFHKWASPAELRARTHAAVLRAMDIEIETLSEREKRENPGQSH